MLRMLLLVSLVPVLCAFDVERARESLDAAFHNLYGADLLVGVEMVIEDGDQRTDVSFALGRKHQGDETRTLIYLAGSDRDAGRALLFQRPGERDRVFVAEGSRGRVRAISAGKHDAPLFDSDFAYEDVRAQRADDFRIEVLGPDSIQGEPCRVLRLRPLTGAYDKVIVWLSTRRPVIVRADYFDRKGLWKRYSADVDSIEEQFEWWVTVQDEMLDLRSGRRTVRRLRNVVVDAAVPDEMFTTTQLAKGRLPAF
jgi:hypothetical protein